MWGQDYNRRSRVVGISMYFKRFGSYNKYHNKKTYVDGLKFDSQKEANDYEILCFRQKRGEIKDLQLQVPFVIIEKSKFGRAIKYIADFTYIDCITNEFVVADSKGVKTDVYKLKKRIVAEKYNIVIKEL